MTQNEMDKQWLNECRDAMQAFEAPAPAGGWEAVAASVDAKAAPVVPLRVWLGRAAAVLLLVLLAGGGIWFTFHTGSDQKPLAIATEPSPSDGSWPMPQPEQQATPSATDTADTPQPLQQQKAAIGPRKAPQPRTRKASANALAQTSSAVGQENGIGQQPTTATTLATTGNETAATLANEPESAPASEPNRETSLIGEEEAVLLAMEQASRTQRKRHRKPQRRIAIGMGMGLGMNGELGFSSGDASADFNYNDSPSYQPKPGPNENSFDGEADEVTSADNHLTWTLGATVSYQLTERVAAVTGLTYTRLTSDVCVANIWSEQEVHYLGLPLAMQYALHAGRRWQWYVSGGTMLERLLHAERGGEKLQMHGWQWSLNAATGVQFRIGQHWGLYAEPNLSYFFDNGSDVPTYRTEHPCSFSMQAGLRFIY